MKRRRAVLVLAALVIAALVMAPRLRRYVAIDSCLDAGGRWDYDRGACERE